VPFRDTDLRNCFPHLAPDFLGIKDDSRRTSIPMKWFGLRLAFLKESSTERSTTFSGQLWCQWTRAVAKVFYCLKIVGSKQDGPHRALLVPAGNFWW